MNSPTAVTEFETLGREISDCMPGWTSELDKDRDTGQVWGLLFSNQKGAMFNIRHHWRDKNKLNVFGIYPKGQCEHNRGVCYGQQIKRYNETLPSILISATRKPSAIAADISRRFLPEYLQVLGRATEARINAEIAHNEREAIVARMLAACPNLRRSGHKDSQDCYFTDGLLGSVKTSSSENVTIELNGITADVAEKILRILN